MKLNEKIYYLRKKAGMSQEALAEQLGVSRQAVSKWETGDAAPDINKLLALSKTFNVTTDWLLSDEEPYDDATDNINEPYDQQYDDNTYFDERYDNTYDEPQYHETWVDRVPGVLGRLLKKYGWILGVRLAIGGALFTFIGAIAKFITGKMLGPFSNISGSMFDGFTDVTIEGFDSIPPEILESIIPENEFFSIYQQTQNQMVQNNPVNMMANFIIALGLILLVGGIILAIVLKRNSDE